jgi:hypothetical protein
VIRNLILRKEPPYGLSNNTTFLQKDVSKSTSIIIGRIFKSINILVFSGTCTEHFEGNV